MSIDLKKRGSRSARLGFNRVGVVANTHTTLISLVLCVVAMLFIVNGTTKVMEQEVIATKQMKQKIVYDTTVVEKDVIVNDCDTVFIIDGKRFKSAN